MRCVHSDVRQSAAFLFWILLIFGGSCGQAGDAGEMVRVWSNTALLDDAKATSGNRIPFGAVLVTDESGVAQFRLRAGSLGCRLREGGEVRIGQQPDAPTVLVAGNLLCSSTGTEQNRPKLDVAGKIVEVGQAHVHMEITDTAAEVGNAEGDVTVDDIQLGAGEQVTIDKETGAVGTPKPIPPGALPSDAGEMFDALEKSLLSSKDAENEPPEEEPADDPPDDEETKPPKEEPTDDPTDDAEAEPPEE
jgi:hypothetical protein